MVVDSVLADFQKLQDKVLHDILDTFTAARAARLLALLPPQRPTEGRASQFCLSILPLARGSYTRAGLFKARLS